MIRLDRDTKILIVGLGVIGGGYAAALKREGYTVAALTKEQADLDYAVSRGIVDRGSIGVDPKLIGEAELIVFALYPTVFINWIEENQHLIKKGALITDVCGVKSTVVGRVQEILREDLEFISAHPMAGRERSGVEYSDPEVFRGANYIVTPTEKNTREAVEIAKELGRILGFGKITELTTDEHDRIIAYLSQLTHVIAVALMVACDDGGMEKYTGDSFRDLTRIAKINDRMWAELFMMNRDALLAEIDGFSRALSDFRAMLAAGDTDGMRRAMRLSTERRSAFDKPV